jgi:multidrug efflux pump subunit AcrA (membrane-fusion protein)
MIRNIWVFVIIITVCQASCGNRHDETVASAQQGTPVTITTIHKSDLDETVDLNATSSFLLKTPVKSSVNGFLQNVRIRQGDFVKKGEVLMGVVTKEAKTLGNIVSNADTNFHFRGEINITAPGSGYVTQLNFQNGDYVQDGEQIATISDAQSFAFILELPYELTPILKNNRNVELLLPDSSRLKGTIVKAMPSVEAGSQTQEFQVAVNSDKMIPENLIARVRLNKSSRKNVTAVPREALLTDETQSAFWVMKAVNDTLAIKIPVQKGMEANGKVEIISPVFTDGEKILLSGNYGLPDSSRIVIVK